MAAGHRVSVVEGGGARGKERMTVAIKLLIIEMSVRFVVRCLKQILQYMCLKAKVKVKLYAILKKH